MGYSDEIRRLADELRDLQDAGEGESEKAEELEVCLLDAILLEGEDA
jgi:hypothetical protein